MSVLWGRLALEPQLSRPHPPFPTSVRLRRLPFASAAPTAPNPQSCDLPSDVPVRAHNKLQHHLDRPDSVHLFLREVRVLRFLRQVGMSDSDIRRAVSRDARILDSDLEENLRPNVAKLRAVGLSIRDISYILSRSPNFFQYNFVAKIDFWLGVLGSADNLSVALKRNVLLFNANLDNSILPNLCFLKDHCGFSSSQILQLIKTAPRVIASNTETLKMKAQMADQLGIPRSSGMFLYALIVIRGLNQQTIDARLYNFKSLGFSQEEVNLIISKAPMLLLQPEKQMSSKVEFLLKEAGCDKNDIVRNPVMLTFSLDKRLIPRNIVRKLLMSKGSPPKLASLVSRTEKQFVQMYVLPNEHAIPGLHRAYADACARKNVTID